MAKGPITIVITFEIASASSFERGGQIHRIRNFAEELSIRTDKIQSGVLPMARADNVEDLVVLAGVTTRALTDVRSALKSCLEKHLMFEEAKVDIIRERRGPDH